MSSADKARVSMWVDEDELGTSDAGINDDTEGRPFMSRLRDRNVSLTRAGPSSSSYHDHQHSEKDSTTDDSMASEEEPPDSSIPKRRDKHAPREISSKKPVSRRRMVIPGSTVKSRDPRFVSLSGEFSSEKFKANYNFLSETHTSELGVLKESLAKARKRLSSVPHHSRQQAMDEIARLELAIKRAESAVNLDRQQAIEHAALRESRRNEKGKQESGKAKWFMKRSERKDVVNRARYAALEEAGGTKAVKKAMARKQRKDSQKERAKFFAMGS